jgi:hypothetical protein
VTAHPLTDPAVQIASADLTAGAGGPIIYHPVAVDPIVVAF